MSARDDYEREGYVIARGLLTREEALSLGRLCERIAVGDDRSTDRSQVHIQRGRDGTRRLIKLSQLTRTHERFRALAHHPRLVDLVETLLGPGARLFRDVIVGKPAMTGGPLSMHQDSAYWDVEPKALLSAWVALTDAPREASCLEVVPGSHRQSLEHGLMLRNQVRVPRPVTRLLRRLVSVAGTGDNPGTAGGLPLVWELKSFVLSEATRWVPLLGDLQDYRLMPEDVDPARVVAVPLQAGDAILFHSLLAHATGPNVADFSRWADVISYMPASARFVGQGASNFPPARLAS